MPEDEDDWYSLGSDQIGGTPIELQKNDYENAVKVVAPPEYGDSIRQIGMIIHTLYDLRVEYGKEPEIIIRKPRHKFRAFIDNITDVLKMVDDAYKELQNTPRPDLQIDIQETKEVNRFARAVKKVTGELDDMKQHQLPPTYAQKHAATTKTPLMRRFRRGKLEQTVYSTLIAHPFITFGNASVITARFMGLADPAANNEFPPDDKVEPMTKEKFHDALRKSCFEARSYMQTDRYAMLCSNIEDVIDNVWKELGKPDPALLKKLQDRGRGPLL